MLEDSECRHDVAEGLALWRVAAAAEKARDAQRAYFAARTPVRLRVSKAAERELDEALETLRSGQAVQARMF